MKKVKLIIAAVAMLGLTSSSAVYADGFAPAEGLYVGALVGGATGVVQPTVVTQGKDTADTGNSHAGGTFTAEEGGLALAGIEGGGFLGYGYKMGDLYAGLEGEMAAGDVEFELTSSVNVELSGLGQDCVAPCKYFNKIQVTKDWTGGMFGRLGYYLNDDTLLAFRGGVLVSKFEVEITGSTNRAEDYYGGGPSFGVSMESRLAAFDPNLSMRVGAVYTDYLTASVWGIDGDDPDFEGDRAGHNSEVTGSALSALIGLQYSFFDANSLF